MCRCWTRGVRPPVAAARARRHAEAHHRGAEVTHERAEQQLDEHARRHAIDDPARARAELGAQLRVAVELDVALGAARVRNAV